MKRVILYTRVSSDEQRGGLSIESQERSLIKYCGDKGFMVVGEDIPYEEDYSAKHFDMRRPEIKRIYNYCKKHRGEVDLVLFVRWDRYSRNTEFAFTYKRLFIDELGVEINAMEEPIDFTSPNWAMNLAIRCGLAQSENLVHAARTTDGIHEHLMRGEWCVGAPIGYKNIKANPDKGTDHYVVIDPIKGPIVKQVFQEVAKGIEAPINIKRRLLPEMSNSNFYNMLRKKFYIGIIEVPAYKQFEATEVRGLHQPLIDEGTFHTVQDILDGKRKSKPRLTKTTKPNLYLRKYLKCPVCGHRITGSTCKGNGGYYDYYCCNNDHKHLHARAEKVNDSFTNFISTLSPRDGMDGLFAEFINDIKQNMDRGNKDNLAKTQQEIQSIQERMNRVNDAYFDGEISRQDREEQLARYKRQLSSLEARIQAIKSNTDTNLKGKLTYGLNLIANLGEFFKQASVETKVKLIGSIFNEEIVFDGKKYRTNSINRFLDYIYSNISELQGKNETDSPFFSGKSACVASTGIEPVFKV